MKSKQIFKLFITHDRLLYASIWPNNDKRLFCKYFTVCYVLEKMCDDWLDTCTKCFCIQWNTDLAETGLNLQGLIDELSNWLVVNSLNDRQLF